MAQTFKSAATGSTTTLQPIYTCPASTTAVVHAMYVSNIDGTNDANISISISGSANFDTRRFIFFFNGLNNDVSAELPTISILERGFIDLTFFDI